MRSALFVAHLVGLSGLVASGMMRSTNDNSYYLFGCLIVCLSHPSRMSNYHFGDMCSQFKQIFGDTVLKHGMVGCTTRESVRSVVHPLFM